MVELPKEVQDSLLKSATLIYLKGQKDNPKVKTLEEKVKTLTSEIKTLKDEKKNNKSSSSSELVKMAAKIEEQVASGTTNLEIDDVRKITNAFTLEKNVTQQSVDKVLKALMSIRSKAPKAEKEKQKVTA